MYTATRVRLLLGALPLFGIALLAPGCPPPIDDRDLACDDYCDGLASCDEGWEVGIDAGGCHGICYDYTTTGEMVCVNEATGCDDVLRCLCYPLYDQLYTGCGIYFVDDSGNELSLDDVVWDCEEDDSVWGFGNPVTDCLSNSATCDEVDACLTDVGM
jgi:hypothetical protein